MNTLDWKNEYNVGIKEIDDQHKSLLGVINTLFEEQKDEFVASKFSADISSLIHYAYTHFATEERYLLQANYPELEDHILEHINFIMKTLSLALKVESSNGKTRKELLLFLVDWYSTHVLGKDREYIPFLISNKNI